MLRRSRAAGLALGLSLLAYCAFPNDQSENVTVTIDSPRAVVVRGRELRIRARAWVSGQEGELLPVPGVSFLWSSSDPDVARVSGGPGGEATVVGLNPGPATITVTPADFADGRPAQLVVRIASLVEIDSVTPRSVHYGDQVTVYGVGLGSLVRLTLGETSLIPDSASFTGDSSGYGSERFWIPYPAVSDRVLAISSEGAAPSPDSTLVIQTDIYDDEAEVAVALGRATDSSGIIFSNPALALTSQADHDIYRFTPADPERAVSLTITAARPGIPDFSPVLSPSRGVGEAFPDGSESWSWGFRSQFCKHNTVDLGPPLAPDRIPFRFTRAFRKFPGDALLLNISAAAAGRYSLTVEDRYVTADPGILPDRLEDDDTCVDADHNFDDAGKRIVLGPGQTFSEVLTIDNPFDVDWMRLRIIGDDNQLVTVRLSARPLGVADSSNLGLLLGVVPFVFGPEEEPILTWLAESHGAGSDETISEELEPADYYLVVGDDIGVATPYALCVTVGSDCVLPP
jgi:hypothetical protein